MVGVDPTPTILYNVGMPREASIQLEAFIDEAIRRCEQARPPYHPIIFKRMRNNYGTLDAIERLVRSGEIQTGFHKLKSMNMLEWTIESAVLKFSGEFGKEIREAAKWRLEQAQRSTKI